MLPTVVFVATYDTKGVESDYIKKRVEANGVRCLTIDVGVGGEPTAVPDVSLAGSVCRYAVYRRYDPCDAEGGRGGHLFEPG